MSVFIAFPVYPGNTLPVRDAPFPLTDKLPDNVPDNVSDARVFRLCGLQRL